MALHAMMLRLTVLLPPSVAGRSNPCNGAKNTSHLPFCDGATPLDDRVADLLGRLTLAEKIGQLTAGNGVNGGSSDNAIPRMNIPRYDWWSEGTHGVTGNYNEPPHTDFPLPITTAMSFNRSLWQKTAQQIGREARAWYNSGNGGGLTYCALYPPCTACLSRSNLVSRG